VTHFRKRASQSIRFAVLFAVALATAAFAQSLNTSELHGTVTDQTGGVISRASVTLESADARKRNVKTDREGGYRFEQVPPGPYTLIVSCQGFMDFATKVELQPEATTLLDVGLEVSAIAVSVNVKEAPGLSTEPQRNLSGLILTGKDLAALPDDPQFLLLKILQMAGSTGRPGDVAVYVNGFREYKRLPPKNTIEIIRINSNPFSAEFSQQSAQRVEIVTKPGSDSFHGDIGVQSRSSALDARNPLSETKPDTRYYNSNGYLQGPISKGHVGFLLGAGHWQQDENAFVHATVLDPSTLVAQPFAATVATPTRVTSGMAQMDFKLFNQMVNVSYAKTDESYRNQGLEGGFSLPEHAYNRSVNDGVGRLWWTSIGRHVVNDLRFEITHSSTATDPLVTAPAVLVLGAFNAGGNQNANSRQSTVGIQGGETLTVQQGSHTFKTGIQIEMTRQDIVDRSEFSGAFTFGSDVERDAFGEPVLKQAGEQIPISPIENYRRTVLGLPGYSPSQFSIVRGNPDVGVEQQTIGWFAMDDWSPSRRVTLSYGVRQELQNNVKLRVNLAPRANLSLLLDKRGKNAIKLGGGILYGRVEPDITFITKKLDGINRQQLIIEHPAGYPISPASLERVQSATYTKSGDLRMPISLVTIVSYERELPAGLFGVAQYTFNKGTHLLRLRNITAPLPGASGPATSPVLQFESTGRSLQHQLMLGLRENIATLTLYGNYTFGKKYSDTDGPYTLPASSHDLSTEYGWAADDQRHTFVAGATVGIPGGILINPSIAISSGRPFNITTGFDNNNDTVFADRPAFAKPGDAGAIATRFGLVNPDPQPGDTIIPRNFGREPRQVTVDLTVSKTIAKGLVVAVDAQNLPNRSRLFGTNGIVTSPLFGMPNQALNGRRLELTIRYGF
jgi:Carboxypeptidase regulatory-like domain